VAVAAGVAADIAGDAERHDREGSFSHSSVAAVWAAGLGNLTVPAALGGVGANLATTARAVSELAKGDASTALVVVMHLIHLRMLAENADGIAEDVRAAVISSSLAGPALINALRVEPELGTPARGGVPATRAVRRTGADGEPVYHVSGRKIFSTGSVGLRWMIVWAATADDDPEGVRSGSFLVPSDAAGISIVETWDHLGMRASASHDVVFDEVEVPARNAWDLRVPGTHPPLGSDPLLVGWMNVLLVAVYHGAALAARDWLVGYLNGRTPTSLGAPLATLPRMQHTVGEMEALLYAGSELVASIARDIDAGGAVAEAAATRSSLVKTIATGNDIRAVELGIGLIGNAGLTRHHPLQRHYRDVLCGRVHSPQDDVVLTATGRAALGASD
jgi:alkylation response protein AidB-like acyl-CoA dehydrogenase